MYNIKFFFVIATVSIAFLNNLSAQNLYPDLNDSSNGITNGYGSWGANNYTRETSVDYANKGTITFYHPNGAATQKPTIFFINGWGRNVESYDKNLKYIASLGYSVVDIYNLNPGNIQESYANSLFMIQEAANLYTDWINTSKIGLMGHSYGAGSTIWLGKEVFSNLNWGKDGRFIMMLAPWFTLLVDDNDLKNYPSDVKLLVLQSYDDFTDQGNAIYATDPRATRAMYQLISIPNSDKDFITIKSDKDPNHTYEFEYNGTTNTYSYEANHQLSYTGSVSGGYRPYDALDVYSTNRLVQAMTDYVFKGDNNAATVALGNGSMAQKDMGIMPELEVTDTYITIRPESDFNYKCNSGWNDFADNSQVWFLENYCEDANNDGTIDTLSSNDYSVSDFSIYPIPSSNYLNIRLRNEIEIVNEILILEQSGKIVKKIKTPNTYKIDISNLTSGIYFIKINTQQHHRVQKFIKS